MARQINSLEAASLWGFRNPLLGRDQMHSIRPTLSSNRLANRLSPLEANAYLLPFVLDLGRAELLRLQKQARPSFLSPSG